jgi:3'-phosphoadenosine 5'-phosphosulfate (PAPS) 3'-phosphatase
MERTIETPDDQTAVTPADESAQPISIRKLDRLETTSPCQTGE